MYRFKFILFVILSCLTVATCLPSHADYSQYDIYYGDINGDGVSGDLYFHGIDSYIYPGGGSGQKVPYSIGQADLSQYSSVQTGDASSISNVITGSVIEEGIGTVDLRPFQTGAPPQMDYWTGPTTSANGTYLLTFKWDNDDIRNTNLPSSVYLERKRDNGAWRLLAQLPWRSSPHRFEFQETGLASGAYTYRARGCNSKGCSNDSSSKWYSVVVSNPLYQPKSPSLITLVKGQPNTGQILLSWERKDPHLTHYELYRVARHTNVVDLFILGGTTDGVTNLVPTDGTYSYLIRGCTSTSVCSNLQKSVGEVAIEFDASAISDSEPVEVFPADSVVTAQEVTALDTTLSTSAEFSVGGSGDARYTVPIKVPEGTAGLTPTLSFNYSSHAGKGNMGIGWSLGGLSSISRCRKTEQRDKFSSAINWTSSDFCLDGVRIVRKSDGSYRLENDSSTKIIQSGGSSHSPDYFTVLRSDGSVATMGEAGTSASEQKGSLGLSGSSLSSRVLRWHISSLSDSVGNKIKFEYFHNETAHTLDNIYYAFSGDGNWKYKISFDYLSRTTEDYSPVGGYYFPDHYLLKSVEVRTNRNELIKSYLINYNQDHIKDAHDRVTRIRECSDPDAGVCLSPINFDWVLPNSGFATAPTQRIDLSPESGNVWIQKLIPADINGDGATDLIILNSNTQIRYLLNINGRFEFATFKGGTTYLQLSHTSSSGPNPTNSQINIFVLDYNGDGRDDLLYNYVNSSETGYVHTAEPVEDGWLLSAGRRRINLLDSIGVEDFNGDGLLDLIRQAASGAYASGMDISAQPLIPNISPPSADMPYVFSQQTERTAILIDWGDDSYQVSYISGGLYINSRTSGAADFNGDGLVDAILQWTENSHYSCPREQNGRYAPYEHCLYRNTRAPHVREYIENPASLGLPSSPPGWYYKPYGVDDLSDEFWLSSQHQLVDIDSDGLTDILYLSDIYTQDTRRGFWKVGGSDWYYVLNTGTGFSEQKKLVDIPSYESITNKETSVSDTLVRNDDQAKLIDVNQDGYLDFVYFDFKQVRVILDDGQFETGRYKVRYWNPTYRNFNPPVDFCPTGSNQCTFTYKYLDYSLATRNGGSLYTSYYVIPDTHFWDVNGDGKLDFIYYDKTNVPTSSTDMINVYLANAAGTPENVITRIEESDGSIINVSHELMSKSDHYAGLTTVLPSACAASEHCWAEEFLVESESQFYQSLMNPFADYEGNTLGSLGYIKEVTDLRLPIVVRTEEQLAAAVSGTTVVDQSAVLTKSYYYGQAKAQTQGQGFLGFKFKKEVNEYTGLQTTTEFRQDWPFTGLIRKQTVNTREGHLLESTSNEWRLQGWSANWPTIVKDEGTLKLGPLTPYLYMSNVDRYALSGNGEMAGPLLNSASTKNTQVDAYGNVLTSVEEITNEQLIVVATKTTTRSFGTADSEAHLGRLSRMQVTDQHNGYTATRVSTFDYYESWPLKGLLKTEVLDPDVAESRLTTEHYYDGFGNRTHSISRDSTGETRYSSRVEYDEFGLYPTFIYEHHNEVSAGDLPVEKLQSRVTSRDKFGNALSADIWVDERTHVQALTATSDFGQVYLKQTGSGGYEALTGARGPGTHCQLHAEYHTVLRVSGGRAEINCFNSSHRKIRLASNSFEGGWIYTDYNYDVMGRLVGFTEPYESASGSSYWSHIFYDVLGREIRRSHPSFGTTTTVFNGYETTTTNSLGQTEQKNYDALGQLVRTVDHNGFRIDFSYDANGKLRTATDTNGAVTTIGYDHLGRKISMDDPNKGSWTYQNNAFGDVEVTRDQLGQSVINKYDFKGRLISRKSYSAANQLKSDNRWQYDIGDNAWGKLTTATATGSSSYKRTYHYDDYGRPAGGTIEQSNGRGGVENHHEKIVYDRFGRELRLFDVARKGNSWSDNALEYRYNTHGYRYQWAEVGPTGNTEHLYLTIMDMDAHGKVTEASYGYAAVSQVTEYYPETGLIKSQNAVSMGTFLYGDLQDRTYSWDSAGNLEERQINGLTGSGNEIFTRSLKESYEYDNLNRLQRYSVSGDVTFVRSMGYHDNGNIKSKSDVGTFGYGDAGPHQVTSAGSASYSYNELGQLITDSRGRRFNYDVYGNISSASGSNGTVSFGYSADGSRILRTDQIGNDAVVTQYFNGVEKISYPDGTSEWKRYIGNFAIVNQTFDSGGAETGRHTRFTLRDSLGNITHLVDQNGGLVDAFDFDPWGKRRNTRNLSWLSNSIISSKYFKRRKPPTSMGYTGHEMMDELELVHMNGRIYDPLIARFIQADPIIQNPTNTQSFNRYSYVWNNPMNAVDPTGFVREEDKNNQPIEEIKVTGKAPVSAPPRMSITFVRGSFSRTSIYTLGSDGNLYSPEGNKLNLRDRASVLRTFGTTLANLGEKMASGEDSTTGMLVEGRDIQGEAPGGDAQERGCSGQMCKGRDPRINTSTWVDPETGKHYYRIRGAICSQGQSCDDAYADSVYGDVNQNDIPFTSNDLGDGNRNLLPYAPRPFGNQPIRHIENAALRTSVNVALEGHNFYPGTVTHRVHFEGGTLFYDIVGVGTGSMPSLNNNAGTMLFTPGVRSVVNTFGR